MYSNNKLLVFTTIFACIVCFSSLINASGSHKLNNRTRVPDGWTRGGRASSSIPVTFTIYLQYQNLDTFNSVFNAVSDPSSSQFGKFLTQSEIMSMIAPSQADVAPILAWLESHGVSYTVTADSITVTTTAAIVEQLMQLELYNYTRNADGRFFVRQFGSAHVPQEFASTIDFVMGLNDFPMIQRSPDKNFRPLEVKEGIDKRSLLFHSRSKTRSPVVNSPAASTTASASKVPPASSTATASATSIPSASPSRAAIPSTTASASPSRAAAATPSPSSSSQPTSTTPGIYNGLIIPEVLRHIHNFPDFSSYSFAPTSIGLIQFSSTSGYSVSDYNTFNQISNNNPPAVPTFTNNYYSGYKAPSAADGESSLDIQYGAGIPSVEVLAGGSSYLNVYYWVINGWMIEFTSQFLSTSNSSRPTVVSISWGADETEQSCSGSECSEYNMGTGPQNYVNRVDTNFKMMGLQGVSVFVASGDLGALGNSNSKCTSSTMYPEYPGSSAYVTSVGGTMLSSQGPQAYTASAPACTSFNIPCSNTALQSVATYPNASITSSGGFNAYTALPSWQSSAVNAYLQQNPNLPPGAQTSNRGFPDVSSIAHDLLIASGGSYGIADGTSASSPIWGGMTALMNSARVAKSKSVLGFINPALYALYSLDSTSFADIATGNNSCTESCCSSSLGYQAAPGWDPVTGLGSPNFSKVFNYFVNTLP